MEVLHMDFSYENLVKQEKDLVFPHFNSEVAYEIGMMLINRAKKEKKTIAASVTVCKQNIFHYAMDGLGPDADNWLRRKSNIVYEYHMSSLRLGVKLAQEGLDLAFHGRNPHDFMTNGGAFPIIVKGAGVIGVIGVTGLPHLDDHEYIVTAITDYLSK
jgi:uncharacterized protein (UPF0303 family)